MVFSPHMKNAKADLNQEFFGNHIDMTKTTSEANFFDVLKANFPYDRSSTALIVADGSTVSYGDLETQSGQLAHRLLNAGAREGDRVMVQVEKTPQGVALYLACLRAGVVMIPLNTGYGKSELEYLAGDAEPSVVICDHASPFLTAKMSIAESFNTLSLDKNGEGTLFDGIETLPIEFETSKRGGDETAAILYTSGTTGKPKGAMISHTNLSSNALTLRECWGFTKDDVLLHALPIFHVHGLFVATNTAMMAGCRMQFLAKFDLEKVLELLPTATVMMGVPTFYTRLLSDDRFDKNLCANMRLFVSGSAPLLADTFKAFKSRTGHNVLERYGMTETSMITSNPLNGDRIPGSVGPSLRGVSIRIIDDAGEALSADEIGGVEVTGPNVFKGYWRNPEKTAAEFCDDGFFKTGDVGRIDKQGYLHIMGRDKDMIISGGMNIYPKEIEELIDQLAGVQEAAVIGLPHPDFGEAVAAVVVRSDKSCDAESIIQSCRDDLASFKCPKSVFFVDELPRNTMGKVEKAKLRKTYSEATAK
jgi:malonyl-CoA/methylmalonyl-CoA synthetase